MAQVQSVVCPFGKVVDAVCELQPDLAQPRSPYLRPITVMVTGDAVKVAPVGPSQTSKPIPAEQLRKEE